MEDTLEEISPEQIKKEVLNNLKYFTQAQISKGNDTAFMLPSKKLLTAFDAFNIPLSEKERKVLEKSNILDRFTLPEEILKLENEESLQKFLEEAHHQVARGVMTEEELKALIPKKNNTPETH